MNASPNMVAFASRKVLMVWRHNWLESAQLSKPPHMSPHIRRHMQMYQPYTPSTPTQAHKILLQFQLELKGIVKAAQGTEHRMNPISIQL